MMKNSWFCTPPLKTLKNLLGLAVKKFTFALHAENADEIRETRHEKHPLLQSAEKIVKNSSREGIKNIYFCFRNENTEEFIKTRDEKHYFFTPQKHLLRTENSEDTMKLRDERHLLLHSAQKTLKYS